MRSKLTCFVTLLLLQGGLLVADNSPSKVPGDNPLTLCSENPTDDILHIDEVTLIPNPPVRGQGLRLKAEGHLKKTLEEGGGTLRFRSWSGDEVIDDESLELCEGLDLFDQECPIKAGHLSVSEDLDLEDIFDIPEGKFHTQINVTTAGGQQVTCLEGEFTF